MYKAPSTFDRLIKDLKIELRERDLPTAYARLIAKVELGFELLDLLLLEDEPITVLWVILGGSHIRHPRFESLTDEQKRAIANARVLLPSYAGRLSWEESLRDYIRHIPLELRLYDFDIAWLEKQIFQASRTSNKFRDRRETYRECLTIVLPFSQRSLRYAEKGEYLFTIPPRSMGQEHIPLSEATVRFSEAHAKMADKRLSWFTGIPFDREPVTVRWSDLQTVAHYIDERMGSEEWSSRLSQITYRPADQLQLLATPEKITLDGFSLLAGMVSSGKSTLMLLLAAFLVYKRCVMEPSEATMERITLVVGDSTSSILLADKLNQWFCGNPEQDAPVAVPILGRSTRDRHLRQLCESRDYQQAVESGRRHWGERFLNPACPLQGLIPVAQLSERKGIPLTPGKEPCNTLRPAHGSTHDSANEKSYLCPLFATCPSQQVYRDMLDAQVWITTPGAMGSGTLPTQLEPRSIRVGDLVYEQSHLVAFDEVDTVMEWFDRLYAQQTQLIGKEDGILDWLDPAVSSYWSQHRALAPEMRRWVEGLRSYLTPIGHVLALLRANPELRASVKRGYFTSRSLFYRLSRRLLGLKEYEDERDDQERQSREQMAATLMSVFNQLLGVDDPLARSIPTGFRADQEISFETLYTQRREYEQLPRGPKRLEKERFYQENVAHASYRLVLIMQQTMNMGDSTQNPELHEQIKEWLVQLIPDVKERQQQLHKRLEESEETRDRVYADEYGVDTLETLAHRLEFGINTALLDRFTRLVFYRWDSRPIEAVPEESPYRRVPSTLLNILPLPPTGRLFGIYHAPISATNGSVTSEVLSTFGYTNIGRKYVTEFHKLRTSLDGKRGPNVLAMSGTSYLPDSTRWHLPMSPAGVLKPSAASVNAILDNESQFKFMPMFSDEGEPLRISGKPDKREAVRAVAKALVGGYGKHGGYLGEELRNLKQLSQVTPNQWGDRGRLLLLVNSYDQCRWVAQELRRNWDANEMGGGIYNLERTKGTESEPEGEDDIQLDTGLRRVDIELFAETNGKILIAPLQSIGRGFNILNSKGKAAFGAVYFLTRPMPHPHDIPAIAQELNRRTDDWLADEDFMVWRQGDSVYQQGVELRRRAADYWRRVEQRSYYRNLYDEKDNCNLEKGARLHANPRRDLAATTAGMIIQAVGRLIRGSVPFHAYFVDAAWAPRQAQRLSGKASALDTPRTSLLAAIIDVMGEYAEDPIGENLYAPLVKKLDYIENFDWEPIES